MWQNQLGLFPTRTYAPTLYHCGPSLTNWARKALSYVAEDNIIVIGCSIGGSCALEVARLAKDRVKSIVLIGTKAHRTPDPIFLKNALRTIRSKGKTTAWNTYWSPLFFNKGDASSPEVARIAYRRRTIDELVDGTTAFHSRPSRQDLLKTFPGQIIFVSGALDIAPGVDATCKQSQMAKHGSCHIIQECGHYVPLEAPDRLNTVLKRELSGYF